MCGDLVTCSHRQALSHFAAPPVSFESLDTSGLTPGRRGFVAMIFKAFNEQFVPKPTVTPQPAACTVPEPASDTGLVAWLCGSGW